MKTTFKKLLASLLVAVMIMTIAPLNGFEFLDFSTKSSALSSSGFCGEYLKYTFDKSTGKLTINGTGNMDNYYYTNGYESPFCYTDSIKSVTIGNDITSIGKQAFYYCTGLKSVTIGDSVTSIGAEAFYYCKNLTNVKMGNSVTRINSSAFRGCSGLESITLPNSVKSIGYSAFEECTSLTNITIPDSVMSIDSSAFERCTNLRSVTIGNSVTSIDCDAFCECTSLTSITIPDNVTSIDYDSFEECENVTIYCSKNSYAHKYAKENDIKYSLVAIFAPVITATNVASSGKIKLTWNAVDGATKYNVYRATSKSGTYKLMKTTTSTSYINTSATAGKTYYYKVKAVAADGTTSKYSNVVTRTCDLARPTGVKVSATSKGYPKLTWNAVDGATAYKVYRSTSKNGTYKLVKTVKNGTSFINNSVTKGTTYYYKVKAVCSKSAADSAYSSVVSKYVK